MLRKILSLVVLAGMLTTLTAMADDAGKTEAVTAAGDWLSLVDRADYDASWQAAAQLFRDAVTPEQWRQALQAVRAPLGGVVSRKVKATDFKTSLPGAPDGQYVVIQYDTEFENKKTAVETVTPMKDADGAWRVSGYYIR